MLLQNYSKAFKKGEAVAPSSRCPPLPVNLIITGLHAPWARLLKVAVNHAVVNMLKISLHFVI
jgi:hypothetical protein